MNPFRPRRVVEMGHSPSLFLDESPPTTSISFVSPVVSPSIPRAPRWCIVVDGRRVFIHSTTVKTRLPNVLGLSTTSSI